MASATLNHQCHLIPSPANHYYSAHEQCAVGAIDRNRPPRLLILNSFRICEIRAIRGYLFPRNSRPLARVRPSDNLQP